MSYCVRIIVDNGKPTVSDDYVAPPDGEYIISGHKDAVWQTASLMLADLRGTQLGQMIMSVTKPPVTLAEQA